MFIDQALVNDIKVVLGRCEDSILYRRVSDAVKIATHRSKSNDWNVTTMDLCVCDGCVTLPADVMTILAVNTDGHPTLIRDQWFQYHPNGTGSWPCADWGYTDEVGPVVTYRDPSSPVKLVAVVENALDSGVPLRVYGWDENGKRIYTTGSGGILEDGMLVPTVYGFSLPNPEAPNITRIDRISKGLSNGFIRLIAVDPVDSSVHTEIGYYLPWETLPSYRRIKVRDRTWLRIRYKRKDIEVRGVGDWINLDNREALLLLVKSVKFRLDNQLQMAREYEAEGIRLLSDEAEAIRPNAITPPKIIFDSTIGHSDEDRLFY